MRSEFFFQRFFLQFMAQKAICLNSWRRIHEYFISESHVWEIGLLIPVLTGWLEKHAARSTTHLAVGMQLGLSAGCAASSGYTCGGRTWGWRNPAHTIVSWSFETGYYFLRSFKNKAAKPWQNRPTPRTKMLSDQLKLKKMWFFWLLICVMCKKQTHWIKCLESPWTALESLALKSLQKKCLEMYYFSKKKLPSKMKCLLWGRALVLQRPAFNCSWRPTGVGRQLQFEEFEEATHHTTQ